MRIERATERESWDGYVQTAAPDSLRHHWVWRDVIQETFGHQPHYLAAIEGGSIRGVLPLVSIRSRLFGTSLVSIPFFSYGGILADSDEARDRLLAGAAELGSELGARLIELRQGDACPMAWQSAASKVTMEIDLPATADEYWKRLSSGMRNKIRQARKHDLRAQWGGLEAVPVFYKIFATNMRNLGTPVYSREFFENQIRRLPDRIRILSLWDRETPVAASFLVAHRRTLELPWSASVPQSRKKYSQVLMYWNFIERAIEEGFSKIDLGRCTPGGGTYEFKRHWNPVERRLHWYYWLAPGASMPKVRTDNARFRLAIEDLEAAPACGRELPWTAAGAFDSVKSNKGMDQTRGSEVNGATAEDPRILHFLSFPFRGGVEEHALSVLIALRNNGFAPFVAAPAPLLKIMEPELAAFGVRCAAIEISSPLDWRGAALLAAMLKRERIDLVHCHMATATLCALPAARMAGAMIIETCHGREFWRKGRRVKASFWVDRQASRFVDKYIAVSHAAAQHLRQVKGISEDKIVVILNGRDLTRLIPPTPEETAAARAELGLHNEPTVLLLGRLAEEKGHALLIEALKLLDSRWPSLIAIFAGTGPLEAEVRALCKAAGVTDRVRFLGYRQDLRPVLAAADMVVLPSVSEGLPLAAVEALAAARPIVATAVGGTPEVVLNDQTGLLIPPGNPAALAEAMDRVLSDRSLALRLGTSGRTFVERHFDVRTQVERTVALYRDLTMSPDSRAVVASDALTPH